MICRLYFVREGGREREKREGKGRKGYVKEDGDGGRKEDVNGMGKVKEEGEEEVKVVVKRGRDGKGEEKG